MKNFKFNKFLLTMIVSLFACLSALAQAPQIVNFTGQVMDSNGNPILDPSVEIKAQIVNPAGNCVLYEETQTVNTSSTNGVFNIQIGSAVGAVKRSGGDSGHTMFKVYQNGIAITGTDVTAASCSGSSYTPATGDVRYLRITMTPSLTAVSEVLSPNVAMASVPQAILAETAQMLSAAGNADMNNFRIRNLVSPALGTDAVNKIYADSNLNGIAIGGPPGTGHVLQYNGTQWTPVPMGGGGTVTNVTGTAPIAVATGSTTPVISISQANGSTNGFLSMGDWTTFNSKMSNSLASGNIWVGNASNLAIPAAMSGDATLSPAGVLNLNTVPVNKGGTGATAFNANKIVATNGTGNSLINFDCPTGNAITFSAGVAGCTPMPSPTSVVFQGGNVFTADMNIGTNDSFPLNLRTGGTNRVSILPSGNVGIGNNAPSSKLEIGNGADPGSELTVTSSGTGRSALLLHNSGTMTFGMVSNFAAAGSPFQGIPLGNVGIFTGNPAPFSIALENVERLRIDNVTGNVGIGTATPSARLSVQGTGTPNEVVLTAWGTYNSSGSVIGDILYGLTVNNTAMTGGEGSGINLSGNNGSATPTSIARIVAKYENNASGSETGQLQFHTVSGGVPSEKMRIVGNGNVGIGTNAPTARLDVAGPVKLGAQGGPISAMGTCSFTGSLGTAEGTQTCSGLPAATNIAVSCSPTVNLGGTAVGLIFRASGSPGQLMARSTVTLSSFTYVCFWVMP